MGSGGHRPMMTAPSRGRVQWARAGEPSGSTRLPAVWTNGWWIGTASIAEPCITALEPHVRSWRIVEAGCLPAGPLPEVVVDASALDGSTQHLGLTTVPTGGTPLRRLVAVVSDAWLGVGAAPDVAARHGAVVAQVRSTALALAASAVTVNAVAVPVGYPRLRPEGRSVLGVTATAAELAHAVGFFVEPANDYVVGQVLSVSGGTEVWGNHAL